MISLTSRYASIMILMLISICVFLAHSNVLENVWLHSFDDGTYSHAYLIVLISGYLYWEAHRNGELELRETISFLAISVFLISLFVAHISILAQLTNAARLATLLVLVASINLLFKTSFKSIFPASFLIFAIPIWGALVAPLQQLSVVAVTYIMSFTNIPVFVDGNFITIPAGIFEIAGGCSGLRYLLVSIAISSLYIYLYLHNAKSAVKFFLFAILGALLTNWIRISLLIVIGHDTNMESPLMKDHNNFGWYLYLPYMFLLFFYGHKISPVPSQETKNEIIIQKLNVLPLSLFFLAIFVTYGLKQHSYSNYLSSLPKDCSSSYKQPLELEPTLNTYLSRCENIENQQHLIQYFFDPRNIDSKPDYYSNTIEPSKPIYYKEVPTTKTKSFIVENDLIEIVLYSANTQSKNKASYKKLRLKNALLNKSGTSLDWSLRPCDLNICVK